jgi:hypothetical protein
MQPDTGSPERRGGDNISALRWLSLRHLDEASIDVSGSKCGGGRGMPAVDFRRALCPKIGMTEQRCSAADHQPYVARSRGPSQLDMPATGRREAKSCSPFVSRTVVIACRMSFGPENQWSSPTVGCGQGDAQRSGACHAPNDFQFVTAAWRNVTRPKSEAPQLAVDARSVDLVRCAIRSKCRRCGTRCSTMRGGAI